MSGRDWRLRFQDVIDAIERIERYVAGMTYDTFSTDEKTIDAVIRNIEIIGEASRYIPPEIRDQHPQIPWSEMRATRNILTHVYFGVSLPIVWQTVTEDLPNLKIALSDILRKDPSRD